MEVDKSQIYGIKFHEMP